MSVLPAVMTSAVLRAGVGDAVNFPDARAELGADRAEAAEQGRSTSSQTGVKRTALAVTTPAAACKGATPAARNRRPQTPAKP